MRRPEPHDPTAPDLSVKAWLWAAGAISAFVLLVGLFPDHL